MEGRARSASDLRIEPALPMGGYILPAALLTFPHAGHAGGVGAALAVLDRVDGQAPSAREADGQAVPERVRADVIDVGKGLART